LFVLHFTYIFTWEGPEVKTNARRRIDKEKVIVLGDTGNHDFDEKVIDLVNVVGHAALGFDDCDYDHFPDGESKMRIRYPARIAGKHIVIMACPTNHVLEADLRDLIYACRHQYGASTITVVTPFLRYRRQDREEKVHEIQRLQCHLRDLKHWGADTLIVCDPHAEATTIRYAKRVGLDIRVADPTYVFADALRPIVQSYGSAEHALAYSPDFGSVERALRFAKALGLRLLATPKKRLPNGEVVPMDNKEFLKLIHSTFGKETPVSCNPEDARGMHLFMREDEVDSGNTAAKTARLMTAAGAASVHLAATQPVCSPGWRDNLFPPGETPAFETVWFGNTRPRGEHGGYHGSTGGIIKTVDMAPVVARELLKVLPYEK
jgi:phosphoribosylpyrophosphate synthetase